MPRPRSPIFAPALALLLLFPASLAVAGTGHPAGFTETRYGAAFTLGTAMAWAPDNTNRLFITRQGYVRGTGPNNAAEIVIIRDGVLLSTPFAVVTPVLNFSECGLIGITFDPAFIQNGYVYVTACVSNSEQQIIRYTAMGDVGIDKTILIPGLPSAGDTHNGGGLSIGPDGKLYFAIGDNRNPIGPDLDLTSMRAKVGRANLDGTVANDNPFFDGPGPNNDFTWARGMRNPFTHTWQPGRNLLWVNDVGGHADQVFQVNVGEHGGWMMYGGGNQPLNHPLKYIRPVFSLMSGGPSGMAIAGSTFYDGTLFPQAYRGHYFFGDFEVPGRVMLATLNPDNSLDNQALFATDASNPLGFRVGPDGALYYLTYDPVDPPTTGGVYRVDYNNSSQALVVDRRNVLAIEGSSAVLALRLAIAPSSAVTVSLTGSGDADVTFTPNTLAFSAADWSAPKWVTLSAAQDTDQEADSASINASSTGLTPVDVAVYVTDDDAQTIVLSTAFVTFPEGSMTGVTVRLATPPPTPLTVTITRTDGDADLSVAAGASMVFDVATYQTPQTLTIAAAEDADTTADVATFTAVASSASIPTRPIAVTAIDNDNSAPAISTTAITTAIQGNPYRYDVDATGLPAPTFALPTAPAGMSIDPTSGVITWVPPDAGAFPVIVRATNGELPDAEQSFELTVNPDLPPTARLSQPQPGAVLSGFIEFFGDGFDDATVVRAEFFVDDSLVFTDAMVGDHFHYGGVNGHTSERFDTRPLADGAHTFRMTVYDARDQSASAEATATVNNTTPADAGTTLDGAADGFDAGPVGSDGGIADRATEGSPPADSSCGCTQSRPGASGSELQAACWLALVLIGRARPSSRRRARASERAEVGERV